MKYYELIGTKGSEKLIERFFDNGKRYIKKTPFDHKILAVLKEQFKSRPVEVELNKNGWIVITKTGSDEQFAKAADSVLQGEELTIQRLAEEEAKMLRKAGYKVNYMVHDDER